MTNNDILRRLRYTFDFNDAKMIDIFKQADHEVTREQISNWLKKDDDEAYVSCGDTSFSIFLNGLIIDRRGKQDRPTPEPDKKITNNIVLRKLKIAFDMKNEDVLALLSNNGVSISKHELSAFFRRTDHKHYRPCKDQVLRNFLQGLQNKYRPSSAKN
ncbi:MAG: hypothetical protein ACJA2Y_000182 [Cycloclasticus pugetii]|uniref:DUF1456 domain-containing protein n=2 Tax=Cycloclasticus TaxID=34067 RepID=S5T4X8_9GAMM|nr:MULTISPECIES: DUF1456 family protein [Cycloclasticus]AFT67959.1 hypothetical protein Q91_1925 [Cycloclasticus sp. P1]AGS38856.1 hypothetical protein CYCME_0515 [Cycloclasticus zancles 78-ME]ATI02505.1 DUF1456 family protein [Cycloclasticus sp. PY97N]EPD12968.1 hypothetical protein L196_07389 [Cycloclasticus pugetii]MBV1898606.1 DUF1456 family protein [Cycloclasticus sp.]